METCDVATVGGICVTVAGSCRAAFVTAVLLADTSWAKQKTNSTHWLVGRFVAGWRLVFTCLPNVFRRSGSVQCWMWAKVQIILRWIVANHIFVMTGTSEGFGMFLPHLQSEFASTNLKVSAWKYQFGFHGEVAFQDIYGYSFMEPRYNNTIS